MATVLLKDMTYTIAKIVTMESKFFLILPAKQTFSWIHKI